MIVYLKYYIHYRNYCFLVYQSIIIYLSFKVMEEAQLEPVDLDDEEEEEEEDSKWFENTHEEQHDGNSLFQTYSDIT